MLPVRPSTVSGAGTSQQKVARPSGPMARVLQGTMQAVFDITFYSGDGGPRNHPRDPAHWPVSDPRWTLHRGARRNPCVLAGHDGTPHPARLSRRPGHPILTLDAWVSDAGRLISATPLRKVLAVAGHRPG